MLEFLKESTFKANDVILRALHLLKKNYISIAGLCFVLFLISQSAAFLPTYFEDFNFGFKFLFMLISIVVFFGLQLVLIKRAILLSHGVYHTDLKNYLPSTKQYINFLFGLMLCSLLGSLLILAVGVLCFPLIYFNLNTDFIIYELVPAIAAIVGALLLLRITFFPFFILEKNVNFFRAVKLSMAFTKGNFFKLLTIFFFLGLASMLSFVLVSLGYWYIAVAFGGISIFLIIPLVSLAMAVAYTDMLNDYKGADNPSFFENII